MNIKLLIVAAFAACTAACSTAPAHRITPPSIAPVQHGVDVVRKHIDSAKSHADKAKIAVAQAKKVAPKQDDLQLALNVAGQEIDALTAELLGAQAESASLSNQVKSLNAQILDVTDQGNKAIQHDVETTAKNKQLTIQRDAAISRYHRLKGGVCLLAAALTASLVGFVVLKFRSLFMLLGPYGYIAMFAIPAIAAGAVSTYLWIKL